MAKPYSLRLMPSRFPRETVTRMMPWPSPPVVAGLVLGVRLRPTFAVLSLEALAACALLGVLLLRVFIVDEVLQAEILVQGGSW